MSQCESFRGMQCPGASFISESNSNATAEPEADNTMLTACDVLDSQPAQPQPLGRSWHVCSHLPFFIFLFLGGHFFLIIIFVFKVCLWGVGADVCVHACAFTCWRMLNPFICVCVCVRAHVCMCWCVCPVYTWHGHVSEQCKRCSYFKNLFCCVLPLHAHIFISTYQACDLKTCFVVFTVFIAFLS